MLCPAQQLPRAPRPPRPKHWSLEGLWALRPHRGITKTHLFHLAATDPLRISKAAKKAFIKQFFWSWVNFLPFSSLVCSLCVQNHLQMVKGLIPLLRPASPAMPAEVAGVRPYFGRTGSSLTKGLIQKLNKREKSQPREWPRHCQHRWHAAWGATWRNPRRTGGPSRHESSLFPQQGRRPRALLCFGAKLSLPTASYGIFRGGCRTPSKTPPGFTLHRGPTRSGSRGCKTVSLSHLWLLIFPSLCPPDYLRDLAPSPPK